MIGDEIEETRKVFVERYGPLEDVWLDTWVEEFGRTAGMVGSGGYPD